MYASIRRYRVDPAKVDQLVRVLEQEFVPAVSQAQGFQAYYLLHGEDGTIASLSLFEDRSGADESNALAADQREIIRSLLPCPPEITEGKVLVNRSRP